MAWLFVPIMITSGYTAQHAFKTTPWRWLHNCAISYRQNSQFTQVKQRFSGYALKVHTCKCCNLMLQIRLEQSIILWRGFIQLVCLIYTVVIADLKWHSFMTLRQCMADLYESCQVFTESAGAHDLIDCVISNICGGTPQLFCWDNTTNVEGC